MKTFVPKKQWNISMVKLHRSIIHPGIRDPFPKIIWQFWSQWQMYIKASEIDGSCSKTIPKLCRKKPGGFSLKMSFSVLFLGDSKKSVVNIEKAAKKKLLQRFSWKWRCDGRTEDETNYNWMKFETIGDKIYRQAFLF